MLFEIAKSVEILILHKEREVKISQKNTKW